MKGMVITYALVVVLFYALLVYFKCNARDTDSVVLLGSPSPGVQLPVVFECTRVVPVLRLLPLFLRRTASA